MRPKTLFTPAQRGPAPASDTPAADSFFAALALLAAALLTIAVIAAILVTIVLVVIGFVPCLLLAAGGFVAGTFGADDGRTRPAGADTAKAPASWTACSQVYKRGVRAGRAMRAAALFMPHRIAERWLKEAENYLSEAKPAQRAKAVRNYLRTAPTVIITGWAAELARLARHLTHRN